MPRRPQRVIMRDRIVDAFENAKRLVNYPDATYSTHVNRNGTVDGEFRVEIPEHEDYDNVLTDLENAIAVPDKVYLSTGVRIPPTTSIKNPLEYVVYRGRIGAQAYYQQGKFQGINFERGRSIANVFKKKMYPSIVEVYVRLYWGPRGMPPKNKRGRGK